MPTDPVKHQRCQHHDFKPPMRDGVPASSLVLPAIPPKTYQSQGNQTVFEHLCHVFDHIPSAHWCHRFEQGLIIDAYGRTLDTQSPYVPNAKIYYYRHVVDEPVVPFEYQVICETDRFLVVDKPHFLTMSPAGDYVHQTLLTRLKYDFDNENLSLVHRLDRLTAGLVLVTKEARYRDAYQRLFRMAQIHKVYHAIAPYRADLPSVFKARMVRGSPFYVMQIVDGAPNSCTKIALLERRDQLAKYELTPETGKLHQLRAHMAHLGAPICHDPYYPVLTHAPDDHTKPLQLLAKSLAFDDPITGEHWHFDTVRSLMW